MPLTAQSKSMKFTFSVIRWIQMKSDLFPSDSTLGSMTFIRDEIDGISIELNALEMCVNQHWKHIECFICERNDVRRVNIAHTSQPNREPTSCRAKLISVLFCRRVATSHTIHRNGNTSHMLAIRNTYSTSTSHFHVLFGFFFLFRVFALTFLSIESAYLQST